jgi:hypothetical protein
MDTLDKPPAGLTPCGHGSTIEHVREVDVRRYLVVANRTLAGGELVSTLRDLAAGGPCAFHVLVPATPPPDHVWTEGEAHAIARKRLELALARFADLGEVTGEVGDEHPVDAIRDVLDRAERFTGVVLSTLKPGISRWLRLDLISRVESFGLPVIHVVGSEERIGA